MKEEDVILPDEIEEFDLIYPDPLPHPDSDQIEDAWKRAHEEGANE